MKVARLCLFFLLLLLTLSTQLSASESTAKLTYTIGIVPQFDSRKIHAIWRPILDELQAKTGYRFVLTGSPSIPDFEREFLNGAFDFAYMNPYHAIKGFENQGYTPLVRDHQQSLQGIIVVPVDSPVTSVKELDGKVIAFPSANALGASLMIRGELADKFNIAIKPRYVFSHSSVYLNAALGQVDAGGGVQKTLEKQPEELRNRLRIIHRTREVTAHPFTVHPRVDTNAQQKVREALIALSDTPQGKRMLSKIPIKQIGPSTINDYQALSAWGLERFYHQGK
jgi:phosphonate transport system substrate-binding protein